jgi:hypothetical protein
LVILILSIIFTGCKTDPDDDPVTDKLHEGLHGTWSHVNDNSDWSYDITINNTSRTIEYTGSYKGYIETSHYGQTSGVLIIRFTEYSAEWANGDEVGMFGALYFIELTNSSVIMADAYTGWDHTMFPTLIEAIQAFMPYQDKAGDFVDWGLGIDPLIKTE